VMKTRKVKAANVAAAAAGSVAVIAAEMVNVADG
jgi:hypothetical protein